MRIKSREIEHRLAATEEALERLLMATVPASDGRLEYLRELVHQRVWQTALELPLEQEEFSLGGDTLYNETSAMQGRILTLIEAAFPEHRQCEALKSEAKPCVWRFYNELRVTEEVS